MHAAGAAVQVGWLCPISVSATERRLAFTLKINGTPHEVDVDGDTRCCGCYVLGMTGTKFDCG